MRIDTLRWADDTADWLGAVPEPAPQLVLHFGPTDLLADGAPYRALRDRFPDATIVGCSAGSQILGRDVDDDAAIAVALRFERTRVAAVATALADSADSFAAGVRLALPLKAPGLAGVLVLSDGLGVNGTQLVAGLASVLGGDIPVSGGLAGDGPRFGRTVVGLDDVPGTGRIVLVGLYGESVRISHAAAGGWDAFGPPRRITRAAGSVLHELDGKPALDLYERYLGEEAEGLPGTALLYPLRIWDPERPDDAVVRTVLAIDRDARTMTFAGDLPEGWSAQLMRGNHAHLVSGAERAALDADGRARAGGDGPRLALLVSCVGRRLLMGQRTADEVEAVGDALGARTVQVGFYSYGEIAGRDVRNRCELHNQTMTVTLIDEALA
jgi:hypothetical protein